MGSVSGGCIEDDPVAPPGQHGVDTASDKAPARRFTCDEQDTHRHRRIVGWKGRRVDGEGRRRAVQRAVTPAPHVKSKEYRMSEKPYVICHMVSPLDGRLLVDPWAPDGSALKKAMHDEYQRLHVEFGADAWLGGTTTMQDFATGTAFDAGPPASPPGRPWYVADQQAKKFAIAMDRHGRLHWDKNTADDGHVVVILGHSVPDSHLAELVAAGVSYLVMPDDDIDVVAMLVALGERLNIRTLLLEGGAKINGAFLKAGAVDEISLLLCPAIDGTTGNPAIFETGATGVGPQLKLELIAAQPVAAGTVHLRYRVGPAWPQPRMSS
ncbi:RibD family protein [Xylophilus sp. GOD-11R]|uniref:RibD family protein n=1 Tax=Xylophilus sp. GOD-11R TaxID=3089814 RepID=UPI00298D3977|nr:RibD family protein [Xylophilus sp. GOD-11R]WPB58338.1 RibD family protein [Xylophilus sp. GOD-11R]